jgi:acyl-CoA reductase-like NAD-dependent aldehyde dehydrogenase
VGMFWQHGQSCNARTRVLLRRSKLSQVKATIQQAADATKVGDRSAVPRLIEQGN